jgi:thiaminase
MSKLNDKVFTEPRLKILDKWVLSWESMEVLADVAENNPKRPIDDWIDELKASEFLEWVRKSNMDIDSICDEAVKVV